MNAGHYPHSGEDRLSGVTVRQLDHEQMKYVLGAFV